MFQKMPLTAPHLRVLGSFRWEARQYEVEGWCVTTEQYARGDGTRVRTHIVQRTTEDIAKRIATDHNVALGHWKAPESGGKE